MILHLLAQDRTMLIEAILGNILNCIVVYTLFGKRKYDWFFPASCAVRYIFYNIGLLSIWNAMYGTQNWYKITMSTCATATALILVIITAILWKEPLSKVMVGVFAAECINDGILYQGMKVKLPIIQECFLVVFIFTVLYFIVRPLLKKYRTYIIKHEVICLTLIFTFFIAAIYYIIHPPACIKSQCICWQPVYSSVEESHWESLLSFIPEMFFKRKKN